MGIWPYYDLGYIWYNFFSPWTRVWWGSNGGFSIHKFISYNLLQQDKTWWQMFLFRHGRHHEHPPSPNLRYHPSNSLPFPAPPARCLCLDDARRASVCSRDPWMTPQHSTGTAGSHGSQTKPSMSGATNCAKIQIFVHHCFSNLGANAGTRTHKKPIHHTDL